ncbi:MAG: restriction endonuclease subunit S [Pseudomonadales bacterium]|nr:restriction endonuclease subunit S [Pseudomonadales bacterium]
MGQAPDGSQVGEFGEQGLPFIQGSGEFGVKHPKSQLRCLNPPRIGERNSLLISVRAPVGDTNIADVDYCIGRGLAAIGFKQYPEALAVAVLQRFGTALHRVAQGTTFAAIGKADLRSLLVPAIPASDARKIARILYTLDTQIERTQDLRAKLEQVKEGLLHDLLTRGVDENGELRPSPEEAPELYKASPLGLIPEAWEIRRGEDLCERIEVGIVIRPTQYYATSGIPILRSANVRQEGIDLGNLIYMTPRSHAELAKSAVSPGDLVTVRTGYPGTTAVIPKSLESANVVDLIISRPKRGIDSNYLAIWVNSPLGKDQVLSAQGGLAQQHFNVGEMKKLLVALPATEEQSAIVGTVAAYTDRIFREVASLRAMQAIRSGLMDDLLTGRVRVTPLLEREAAAVS